MKNLLSSQSVSLLIINTWNLTTLISLAAGPAPSSYDCYTTLRSLKTLKVRLDAAIKNAYVIAHFLNTHPKVARVLYPGLKDHPNSELAKEQMRAPGAMISIYLKG